MDKVIEIKINGSHLTRDSQTAGVQHEGNATVLRMEFDAGWDAFAKTVTFWNARGENPVKRILTADLLENILESSRIYRCPIPPEAMTEAGKLSYIIDGMADGVRQRSVEDQLKVLPAGYDPEAGESTDPTPTQAEQLQVQVDALRGEVREGILSGERAKASEVQAKASADAAAASERNAAASQKAAASSEAKAESAANRAEGAVAGVASFNGRTGAVKPQAGDYTADMVGAVAYLVSSPGATLLEKVKHAYEGGFHAAFIGLWETAPLEDAEGIQWGYAEYRKHATGFITVTIRNDVVAEPTKRRAIHIADWTWYGDWHKTATTADLDALTAADVGAMVGSIVKTTGSIKDITQSGKYTIAPDVEDMPFAGHWWIADVGFSNGNCEITAKELFDSSCVFTQSMANGTFHGWKHLATTDTALLLDGSNAMTGDLRVKRPDGTSTTSIIQYGAASRLRNADADGAYQEILIEKAQGLRYNEHDSTGTKGYDVLHSGNVGDYAVKKDGSNAMTGNLLIAKNGEPLVVVQSNDLRMYGQMRLAGDKTLGFEFVGVDSGNRAGVWLDDPDKEDRTNELHYFRVKNGVGAVYPILHTGNKPSGSYTGNGDATVRTIDIGGIGGVCEVYNGETGAAFAFVTGGGAMICNNAEVGDFSIVHRNIARLDNGVLRLATTARALNENGHTYFYHVL